MNNQLTTAGLSVKSIAYDQQFHQLCADKFFQLPEALTDILDDTCVKVLWKIHQWTQYSGKDYNEVRNHTDAPDRWIPKELDAKAEEDYESLLNIRWLYNSYKAWADKFKLTIGAVRRAFKILRELNLIYLAQFGKSGMNGRFDRRYWVAINYEVACNLLNAETLTESDVQKNSHRSENNCTSSYIPKDNSSKNNVEYNNSDVAVACQPLVLNQLEENQTDLREDHLKDCRNADNKEQDLSVKPETPHEDQEFRPAPRPVKSQPKQETVDPDLSIKQKLIEGMGIPMNPKLKGILSNYTIEQVAKGIAYYLHKTECMGQVPLNRAGFIVDAIKNSYIEGTELWISADSNDRNLIILFAAGTAWGIKSLDSFKETIATQVYTYREGFCYDLEVCDRAKRESGWLYTLNGMKATQEATV